MEHDNVRKQNISMYVYLGHHAAQQKKGLYWGNNLKKKKENTSFISIFLMCYICNL